MKHRTLPVLAAALLAGACHRAAPAPEVAEEADTHTRVEEAPMVPTDDQAASLPAADGDALRAAGSLGAFNGRLADVLLSQQGNLVYSPYSISAALHLALLGANGATSDAIAATVSVDDASTAHADWHALSASLQSDDGVQLNIANRFYAEQTLETQVVGQYRGAAQSFYGADLGLVDFATAPDAARREVNAWVSDQTAEMIPDLLPAGSVDTSTVAVLVNAIHFLGDWATPFEVDATADGTFTTLDGGELTRPLMHRLDILPYADSGIAQQVGLAYEGRDWMLRVILPAEGEFDAVGQRLARGEFVGDELGRSNVSLTLPRFEATWKSSLVGPLASLGMGPAFSDAADFSGMIAGGGVTISDVIHEAVIVVDERGTEAAAATGIMVRTTSMPAPPVAMTVDRPFYFVLEHVPTSTALFVGRIVEPAEARPRD